MSKVLTVEGTSPGLVAIHEPGANIKEPIKDVDRTYFHSDFDYLQVNEIFMGSYICTTRPAGVYGVEDRTYLDASITAGIVRQRYKYITGDYFSATYPFLTAIATETVVVDRQVIVREGMPLTGKPIVQSAPYRSYRAIGIGVSNTGLISIAESCSMGGKEELPGFTLPYKILVYINLGLSK